MTTNYSVDVAQIAKVCHEANKAYCETLGDTSVQAWESCSQQQRDSIMTGVLFRINNPDAPACAQHDAWLKNKVANGWRYGAVKDEAAKTHPSLVDYDLLPPAVKVKDALFTAVVKAFGQAVSAAGSMDDVFTQDGVAPQLQSDPTNDPSIEIGGIPTVSLSRDYVIAMRALGFQETLGSFVYNAAGRAIWVSPKTSEITSDVTEQIVAAAEEIGKRTKINEIRSALDLPQGEIECIERS